MARHFLLSILAREAVLAVLDAVAGLPVIHELLEADLDAAEDVVGRPQVRVPELEAEPHVGDEHHGRHEDAGVLVPARLLLCFVDAGRCDGLAEFAPRYRDVRVTGALLGAAAVIALLEAPGGFDINPNHTAARRDLHEVLTDKHV